MIGRADDVREIATALENGTNLIVPAPRRTGKTSVCDAALGRPSRRGYYTVHLDLFRIAHAADLAETLTLAVIPNRSPARRAIRRARDHVRNEPITQRPAALPRP